MEETAAGEKAEGRAPTESGRKRFLRQGRPIVSSHKKSTVLSGLGIFSPNIGTIKIGGIQIVPHKSGTTRNPDPITFISDT